MEEQFVYETGEPTGLRLADCGINDARLAIVDDLEIPALDESLVIAFQNWKELRGMWVETKANLDLSQQSLAQAEAEIRKSTPAEAYKAGSAPERKARLNDIVQADLWYQEVQKEVLIHQREKDTLEVSIATTDKEMSYLQARLNWRSRIVDFMGTVRPITIQQMAL